MKFQKNLKFLKLINIRKIYPRQKVKNIRNKRFSEYVSQNGHSGNKSQNNEIANLTKSNDGFGLITGCFFV